MRILYNKIKEPLTNEGSFDLKHQDEIKTNYITTEKVKADYMEVANWTSAGKIL